MGVRRQGRILAFQALYAWEHTQANVTELLAFPWYDVEEMNESSRDEGLAFARLLVSGTLENLEFIDKRIKNQLEHWDFSRISKVDLSILRVSVYALLFVESIPASVSIDEAVVLAREFGSEESYRFVNGVLDGIRQAMPHAEA
ncbi:MAG: transcription antitermination factor NusB [Spirochaetota bacterium]